MKFAEFTYLEKTNFTVTTHASNLPLYGMAIKTLPNKTLDHGKDTEYNQKLINCSMLLYSGKIESLGRALVSPTIGGQQ